MLDKTSRSWGKQDSETLLETIFRVEKKKALQNSNDMKEKKIKSFQTKGRSLWSVDDFSLWNTLDS